MSGISRMDPCLILGGDSPKVDPGKSRHVFAIGFCLEKVDFSPSQRQKLNSSSFPREVQALTDPRAGMGQPE